MMASSSRASSGSSSMLRNSSSEEDLQQIMDQRKRKRLLSNRESARRSRMRKQQHLDDLTAQLVQHRKENNEILAVMNITTQLYMNMEAENSILRAQMGELSNRLDSLNEITSFLNLSNGIFEADPVAVGSHHHQISDDCFLMNPRSNTSYHVNSQHIMDIVMY